MLNRLIKEFPLELRFMLASVSDLNKTKQLLDGPINWDKFMRLAEHHRVYPSVFMTLRKLGNPLVPEHVLDVLKQKCQENTIDALRITGEAVRVVNILEQHKISAVVLKGAPLSWRLYGDIAARPYVDIDILVAPDKLDQSIAIMKREGYCRISKYDSYDLTPRQLQIYLRLRHHEHSSHYEYWNYEKRTMLEIHWKLSKYDNVLPFPVDGNINTISVAGYNLPVLSDKESLLYLILHGAGHKWHRLCWLVDINKFIKQEHIDWANLDRLAGKYGLRVFLHQALIMVNHVFGTVLPSVMVQDITRDRTARRLAALAMKACIYDINDQAKSSGMHSLFVNYSYGLYMNSRFKNKINYVVNLFRPAVEDIRLVALPDRLYAFYYIIGPFTFIARRLQKIVRIKQD